MNEAMAEATVSFVFTIAAGIISIAATYAALYFKKAKAKVEAQIAKVNDEKQQQLLYVAMEQVQDLVGKTVGAIEQTVAKDLREAVKNGGNNREALTNLAYKAYADVLDQMKPEYLNALEAAIENAEDYILKAIESKVLEMKYYSQK